MKIQLTKFIAILVVISGIFSACSSAKKGTETTAAMPTNTGIYQTLADHLRRNPSVKIIGSGEDIQVMLRGVDAFGGSVEPLYIIDNAQLETYAQASRTVDVNDIRSVQVLNTVEATTVYGMRGSRGAIVIRTKSKN